MRLTSSCSRVGKVKWSPWSSAPLYTLAPSMGTLQVATLFKWQLLLPSHSLKVLGDNRSWWDLGVSTLLPLSSTGGKASRKDTSWTAGRPRAQAPERSPCYPPRDQGKQEISLFWGLGKYFLQGPHLRDLGEALSPSFSAQVPCVPCVERTSGVEKAVPSYVHTAFFT